MYCAHLEKAFSKQINDLLLVCKVIRASTKIIANFAPVLSKHQKFSKFLCSKFIRSLLLLCYFGKLKHFCHQSSVKTGYNSAYVDYWLSSKVMPKNSVEVMLSKYLPKFGGTFWKTRVFFGTDGCKEHARSTDWHSFLWFRHRGPPKTRLSWLIFLKSSTSVHSL